MQESPKVSDCYYNDYTKTYRRDIYCRCISIIGADSASKLLDYLSNTNKPIRV
jgi:hypothetical protein